MEKLIHIIPLGWEADRAVLPVVAMKAHRVHLLCNPASHPRQLHFFNLVSDRLAGHGIEVVHREVDADSDLKGMAALTARIIRKEAARGNRVYVNIAAAGKLAAIGAMMAAMTNLRDLGLVYYVRPEEYIQSPEDQMKYGLTRGMAGDPFAIPVPEVQLPSEDGIVVLSALAKAGGRMRYRELFDALHRAKRRGFRDVEVKRETSRVVKTRLTVRLSKTILQPLTRAGLVIISKEGRERVVGLTTSGEYTAALVGDPEGYSA